MIDLMAQLTQATGLASSLLWQGLLVFMRVGSALSLIPAFGERSVPQRVRLVIALAFSLVVLPSVSSETLLVSPAILPLLVEVVIGLLLGISLRLFILALQTAATIAAQATTLSQMFGDAGPEPQPAIGNLMVMAALALAVASGLHVQLAEFFILWGVAEVSKGFALAFSLAAPFTIAALLYNITLGVINRAMPALMVSFIGAPALTFGGLVLMALAVPLGLALWLEMFQGFMANPVSGLP